MDRSLHAEVLALRSMVTAWMMASLSSRSNYEVILQNAEGYAQTMVEGTLFTNLSEDDAQIVRDIASARMSQLYAQVAGDLRATDPT